MKDFFDNLFIEYYYFQYSLHLYYFYLITNSIFFLTGAYVTSVCTHPEIRHFQFAFGKFVFDFERIYLFQIIVNYNI